MKHGKEYLNQKLQSFLFGDPSSSHYQPSFQVNFAALNSTYEVDTPCCSAKQLDEYYKAYKVYRKASKASAGTGTPLTLEEPVLPGSGGKEDPERKKSSASGRVNFAMAMGQGGDGRVTRVYSA